MTVQYGSIQYFELIDLQDRIKAWKYEKFGLEYLDKLQLELEMKIKAIEYEYTTRITGIPKVNKGDTVM